MLSERILLARLSRRNSLSGRCFLEDAKQLLNASAESSAPGWRPIWYLLSTSLVIRLTWLVAYPRVIENEGAQYLRLAENLFTHRGYVAMRGPVTMVSPLYSVVIGIVAFVTQSPELAGRVVSLMAGTVLPVLLFLVAFKIYGLRTAYVVGALAAFQPLLIALSSTVYSEGIYLLLLMAGLYATVVTLESERLLAPALAGMFAGLAYLARPEGLLYGGLFAFWIVAASWWTGCHRPRYAIKAATVLLALTVLFALPFIIFLSAKIGHFYWEGKSSINDNLVLRMSTGMSQPQANSGLGPNLREDGVALQPDQFVYARKHPVPLGVKLHLIADGWLSRFMSLLRDLWSAQYFGAPFVLFLAATGFLGGPCHRRRFANESLLCLMTALLLFILGSMHFIWDRFLFPLIPFLVLWSGRAAVKLFGWVEHFCGRLIDNRRLRQRVAVALAAIIPLLALVVAARGVFDVGEIAEARSVELKNAGLWLASHGKSQKTVMTVGMVVPYYGGATAMMLPYSDSASALAYAHKKEFDFMVLRNSEKTQRPYLPEWLQNGIPDPCAQLAQRIGDSPDREILIYQWNCGRGSGLQK